MTQNWKPQLFLLAFMAQMIYHNHSFKKMDSCKLHY